MWFGVVAALLAGIAFALLIDEFVRIEGSTKSCARFFVTICVWFISRLTSWELTGLLGQNSRLPHKEVNNRVFEAKPVRT